MPKLLVACPNKTIQHPGLWALSSEEEPPRSAWQVRGGGHHQLGQLGVAHGEPPELPRHALVVALPAVLGNSVPCERHDVVEGPVTSGW
jgi:hypothetical protein